MITGIEIARRAKEQLAALTGLKPDTVSAIRKGKEGWHVNVEFVELNRIPEGSDVLATYEAVLCDEGTLLSYERTKRYLRQQTMDAVE